MAANEDDVILGVDFAGQQGINAFLNAFEQIPAQVQQVLERLTAAGAGGNIMGTRGRQVAEQFIKGTQAGLAGFSGFKGDQFGSSVLTNAGLSTAQIRGNQDLVRSLNQVRADMTRAGDPITKDKQFTQATTLGLRGVELTAKQSQKAVAQLTAGLAQMQQRLVAVQLMTKNSAGLISSDQKFLTGTPKTGVAWTKEGQVAFQQFGQPVPAPPLTSTGNPNQASARRVVQNEQDRWFTAQRQLISTTEQELSVLKSAPIMAPRAAEVSKAVLRPETLRQIDARDLSATRQDLMGLVRPMTPQQQQIVQALGGGLSQRDTAAMAGTSRYQVQKVGSEYAPLIASMKEEAAARRAAAEAAREAAAAERRAIAGTASNVDGLSYRQKTAIRQSQLATESQQAFAAQTEAARTQVAAQARALQPGRSGRSADWYQGDRAAAQAKLMAAQPLGPLGPPADRLGAPSLAAQTPTTLGRSAYYETAMGQDFLRRNGLGGTVSTPQNHASSFDSLAASGGLGKQSFKDSFDAGFRGPDSKPFGEMVGQTARIAMFYGVAYRALTLLQNGLTATIAETLKYEQSLMDLDIITSRSRESNTALAGTLSAIAVAAGFTPSSGVELGSKALGLYGVTEADKATQDRTIQLSSTVATRIARVSGGDPIATQTQLAGALRSLGWGVERLTELEDTITYISRNTGQSSMELLGAVSNISTLGTSAGFSPQQLAALVAEVGTTTGQNPESTAGQFRQLLSRSADTIGPKAGVIFNQDFSGKTIEQIFETVSKLNATQEQTSAFASLFGKGGSQQVAEILTQHWGRVNTLASNAKGAEGIGRDVYEQAMGSISNELKRTGAAFINFGISMVESGILDWVAAAISGSRQLVEAGTKVLDLFNSLPRPLRGVGLALAEIYGAALLFQRFSGVATTMAAAGGAKGMAGKAATGIAAALSLENITARIKGAPVAVGGALRTAAVTPVTWAGIASLFRGSSSGGITSMGRLFGQGGPFKLSADARGDLGSGPINRLKGATGLTGLGLLGVAGAALAVGDTVKTAYENHDRASQLMDAAQSSSSMANSVEKMREAASQAATTATDIGKMGDLKAGDVMGLVPGLIAKFTEGGNIAEAQKLSDYNTKRADLLEAAQTAAKETRPASVFAGDYSAEGLAAGMQALKDRGFNATEQMVILNGALSQFAEGAKSAANAIAVIKPEQIDEVAQKMAPAGMTAAGQVSAAARTAASGLADVHPFATKHLFDSGLDPDAEMRKFEDAQAEVFNLSSDEQNAMNDALRATVTADLKSLTADGTLSEDDVKKIYADATDSAMGSVPKLRDAGGEYKKLFSNAIGAQIGDVLKEFSAIVPKSGELAAYFDVASASASAAGNEVRAATGSDVAGLQRELDILSAMGGAMGGVAATDDDLRWLRVSDTRINTAKRNLVNAQVDAAHALVSYQQSFLASDDITGRLAIEKQSLQADLDMLRASYPTPNEVYNQVKSGIPTTPTDLSKEHDVQAQQNARDKADAADALAILQNKATASVSPGDSIGVARVQAENARLAREALAPINGAVPSSAYFGAATASTQANFALTQASIQGVNANALANIDPRAQTARLQQQIANAQREMKLYPKGDPQAGNLRDQVTSMRQQLAQTVVAEVNSLASANIAGSRSQLAQASVAIGNADRILSLQLAGTEAYYNALAQLRSAKVQLAQAERDQADRSLRLGSDLTDPVAQARLDTQKARDQLTADTNASEGVDITSQDTLDLRGAQSREEAAAFSQRISDIQVAEDLGRISHTQYISYLQSEHDRLTAIGAKTRQQQEELNQVDQLMKSAAEQLQGQFNIGDIKLPTIYEVRRAMQSGAPTQVADYSNSNNVVNINGAPISEVIEYLRSYLGAGAQVVTATTGRKL